MTRSAAQAFDSGEDQGYRSVSLLAVLGLILGFLAPLAFIHPLFWAAPAAGIVVSVWALWDIARESDRLTGRGTALVGLALALLFGTAAVGKYFVRREMAIYEAKQTIDIWFDFLRHDEPHRAHQLSIKPEERFPIDEEDLWQAYRDLPRASAQLKEFVEKPEIRALLKLGERAHVRFYSVEGYVPSGAADGVKTIYAVTYEEAGKPKTFFIQVTAVRWNKPVSRQNPWYIAHIEGGVRPPSWPE